MKNRIAAIGLVALLLLGGGNAIATYRLYQRQKKTVVVDVIRLANEFQLKKDLEERAGVKLNAISAEIDSMKAVYGALAKSGINTSQQENVARRLDTLGMEAQRSYEVSNQVINEQLWTRLNALIDEYGKEYDYTLVIGSNGMGTVLYNETPIDKTVELIAYVNSKYEKGH